MSVDMKRRGTPPADKPEDPKKILRIVRMLEGGGLNYTEVGKVVGMTGVGVKYLYLRWRGWAETQQQSA